LDMGLKCKCQLPTIWSQYIYLILDDTYVLITPIIDFHWRKKIPDLPEYFIHEINNIYSIDIDQVYDHCTLTGTGALTNAGTLTLTGTGIYKPSFSLDSIRPKIIRETMQLLGINYCKQLQSVFEGQANCFCQACTAGFLMPLCHCKSESQ